MPSEWCMIVSTGAISTVPSTASSVLCIRFSAAVWRGMVRIFRVKTFIILVIHKRTSQGIITRRSRRLLSHSVGTRAPTSGGARFLLCARSQPKAPGGVLSGLREGWVGRISRGNTLLDSACAMGVTRFQINFGKSHKTVVSGLSSFGAWALWVRTVTRNGEPVARATRQCGKGSSTLRSDSSSNFRRIIITSDAARQWPKERGKGEQFSRCALR